jgi:hypothetical protein
MAPPSRKSFFKPKYLGAVLAEALQVSGFELEYGSEPDDEKHRSHRATGDEPCSSAHRRGDCHAADQTNPNRELTCADEKTKTLVVLNRIVRAHDRGAALWAIPCRPHAEPIHEG